MKEITKEWLKAAQDDLDAIQEILPVEHLAHIVAFHAQQCVEKSAKAVIEEYELYFIKTHSIETLL